jgi:hypothetical protein
MSEESILKRSWEHGGKDTRDRAIFGRHSARLDCFDQQNQIGRKFPFGVVWISRIPPLMKWWFRRFVYPSCFCVSEALPLCCRTEASVAIASHTNVPSYSLTLLGGVPPC